VQLLTRLGFDTGFEPYNEGYRDDLRAGLEYHVDFDFVSETNDAIRRKLDKAPRIIKAPEWSMILKRLLVTDLISVDAVIMPIRDLDVAAKSRLSVGLDWLVLPNDNYDTLLMAQANVLAMTVGRTIEACLLYSIPCTLMSFPLLVNDARYCYDKLAQVFGISWPDFQNKYAELANPQQVKW